DISHVLASAFKDLYTGDVFDVDMATDWIKSQREDSVNQDSYIDELEKLLAEYKSRLTEADKAEEEIIRAQAQAKAEEEKVLNQMKTVAGEDFHKLGLPPVASSFQWIVDNELLRKHNLICPEDYITEKLPLAKAPKGESEPGYLKGARKQRAFSLDESIYQPDSVTSVPTTLSSTPDSSLEAKTMSKKTKAPQKRAGKESKSWKAEELSEYLSRLEKGENYLKNPRFFPPNTLHGGKSLVISQEKVGEITARRKAEDTKGDTSFVPVFLASPPSVLFSYDKAGQVYEMTIELRNITSTGQHVRLIPPSTSVFFIWPGKYPGKGGMIAPGMACQYTVQFTPKYLGEYEDHILVESQASEPFVIPIQAKVSLPVLTLPDNIDCGSCLVGGIKTTAVLCRNEGARTGNFSIVPEKAWPAPDSEEAATADFVIQDPFAIQPAVLEVAPGQNATVEVVFFPSLPEASQQTFTILCDNYPVSYVTVTGVGELIALELLFVTGGKSKAQLGEVTDATAQHLIRFQPQNPHTTKEKILVVKNSTHVELPFFWRITKPNLKPFIPKETADFTEVKYNQDPESAFSLNPEQGVLLPCADHEFILTYTPQELKSYHSVIRMVLRDIPESPCLVEEGRLQNIPECRVEDVIALEIEVKGSTEPLHLLLEPYAIIVPGENFIGVNVKKTFKLWNNSKTLIKYTWEKITASEIMEVEPCTDVNECCEFVLAISGSKPGIISRNLQCHVELCPEPVVLHVEAAFKGPFLCIDVPSLRFGLTKQGETVSRTFEIKNLCQVPAQWRMQESQAFLAERNEEVSSFTIQPSAGEIPPLGLCRVSVQFTSLQCQRLQTVLELEVENGEGSHLPVFVEVQTPQACLISSHLVFTEIYSGVPVKATTKLFNQTLLPAKYLWGKLIGSQAAFCSIAVSPASGTLGPNEEKEFCIELSVNTVGELKDLTLSCSIEDMAEPLFLSISGEVKGLHVTYSVPSGSGVDSDEGHMPQSPCELLLDFGSEVAFKDVVKRQLILTNSTLISAPFTLEAEYFSACLLPPEQGACPYLVKRRGPITEHAARKVKSGTLEAFQQITIEISAYNNMWGEYQDNLVCKVTGPQPEPPIIRFGTRVSGGSPVLRRVQLNNPTPFDIRLDLEIYHQEPDDEKLVDLLVLFGYPFPPADMTGNEAASSGSTSESEVVLKLDPTAIPCGSIYPALETMDEPPASDSKEKEISSRESTGKKIVSVLIRPHVGVPADSPYSIAPKQIVFPGGGSSDVYISFTPLVLPDTEAERRCEGVVLGFMSLDDKLARMVPNKVRRSQGYEAPPFRMHMEAVLRHPLLELEMDHDRGMVFYAVASDLLPARPFYGVSISHTDVFGCFVLTDAVITQSLKLMNCTKVPLYFRLFLSTPSMPFSLSSADPKKSTKTSHSKKEEREQQLQHVLYPEQNMLVKVSFHTTQKLLRYQHLPETQLLPGCQVLQLESGERKLKFNQNLVIEHSNYTTQLVPVTAYLTVPVLELSCDMVDFQTCIVAQTKTEHVFLYNWSGCRSYWTALLDEQKKPKDMEGAVFTSRQCRCLLPAELHFIYSSKTEFHKSNTDYEAIVIISGMLEEKPCRLYLRGQGVHCRKLSFSDLPVQTREEIRDYERHKMEHAFPVEIMFQSFRFPPLEASEQLHQQQATVSLSKVTTCRAPVQPRGCPSAMAPPRGFTFSMGMPSFSTQYTAWKDTGNDFMEMLLSFLVLSTPLPGGTPTTAKDLSTPSTGSPSCAALERFARRTAAAPSLTWLAFPVGRDLLACFLFEERQINQRNSTNIAADLLFQLCQAFQRRGGPDPFVLVHNDCFFVALSICNSGLHWNNLSFKQSHLLSFCCSGKKKEYEGLKYFGGKWELEQSGEGQVSNSTDILRPRPENHPFPHFHGNEKGWYAKFPEQQGRNLKVKKPKQTNKKSIYFCWEAKAKASCFFRETPNFSATFSDVILGKKHHRVNPRTHLMELQLASTKITRGTSNGFSLKANCYILNLELLAKANLESNLAPEQETQLLIRNWLRQKLFNHQFKNYHEMKTDCEIQLGFSTLWKSKTWDKLSSPKLFVTYGLYVFMEDPAGQRPDSFPQQNPVSGTPGGAKAISPFKHNILVDITQCINILTVIRSKSISSPAAVSKHLSTQFSQMGISSPPACQSENQAKKLMGLRTNMGPERTGGSLLGAA
ncbi:Deleted in lung and esophageal cancer protein 1, partial [Lamprotornis superbus]